MVASNKSPVKWQQRRQLAQEMQEKVDGERKGGERVHTHREDKIERDCGEEREIYNDNGGPRRGKRKCEKDK